MDLKLFGIFLVALLLGAIGQLSMKLALTAFQEHTRVSGLATLIRAMLTPGVVFGLSCFVVSSMLYLFVMAQIPLSMLYPMVALNYVIVTILSVLVLKEHVPPLRIVGLAIIIAGVVCLSASGQPPDRATGEPAAGATVS